jgi:hypothetical protein
MLVFDFLTAGSSPALAAAVAGAAAAGAAGVAAAGFAGVAGAVAAAGAGFGAGVVCADATNPAVASSAKIRVFFNMCVSPKAWQKGHDDLTPPEQLG